MKDMILITLLFFLLLFSSSFSVLSSGANSNNSSLEFLVTSIREYAFKSLVGKQTGMLYQVQLPEKFSGMEASAIRLRTGQLWNNGIENNEMFHVPSGMKAVPPVRRLVIIFKNLGNWSSSYYKVPNYTLVAPIIGFSAYDATNISCDSIVDVELIATRDPVSITFPQLTLSKETDGSALKCAAFSQSGSVGFTTKMSSSNMCLARTTGHFVVVAPKATLGPPMVVEEGKGRKWRTWLIASVVGVITLTLLGLIGMGICSLAMSNKMKEMERRASDGEALESVSVGKSRMPSAAMVRTQPAIENETAPRVSE